MIPADALIAAPEKATGFGVPKLVWFRALKNSVRNCRLVFSDTPTFFNNDRSRLARPGPRNVPRPKFPQVPIAGTRNAFGSNHCVCFCGSTVPEKSGFIEGRSGFRVLPSPDLFEPSCGVNGKPLNNVVIPFNCQPPISLFVRPPALLSPKGNS